MIRFIIFSFFLLYASKGFTQYYSPDKKPEKQTRKDFWERVYPGGNFGLSLGNPTFIQLSPLVGYWVAPNKYTAGLMLTYVYYNAKYTLYNVSTGQISSVRYSSHVVGISPFNRFFITEWLFAHAELGIFNGDAINYDLKDNYLGSERRWALFPLVGGGFNYKLGERGGFTLMALYNLNYQRNFTMFGNTPFSIRLGFYF